MGASARARHHRWRVLLLAALPGALLVTTAANAAPPPAPGDAGTLSVQPSELTVLDRHEGAKSPTSRGAETDPELLGRTDATPTPVMIKLDYDSVATYAGMLQGLPATSPSVTGRELAGTTAAEQRYERHISQTEDRFTQSLAAAVPDARVGRSFRTVYGGVSAVVPANRIGDVVALPDVVAVQQDKLEQLLTDSSPAFIGATSLYPQLGGNTQAGQGVIIGVLDSGVWPEHPSFADQGNLPAPPPRRDGTPRSCDFGDNPLTPGPDTFACNKKLIEGEDFLETYNAVVTDPPEVYPITARDSNGHGTHTASTSAGNVLDSAELLGVDRGPIGGIAPGAHVAAYKVCGALGCFQSDTTDAVAEAIRDGVSVINFSISGGQNPRTDPVELAFLDAYTAGVFVAASAGNSGPDESTTDHRSPWVTTVAASTQARQFESMLTVTGEDGATATFEGSTITAGIADDTPVVFPLPNPDGTPDPRCMTQQPADSYDGVIVACERGPGRVLKGFTVFNAGAAGMILYNTVRPQTEMTDNHWLPTVHIDEGEAFVDFAAAHGALTATFTAGEKGIGDADVMADFSSRGPGGSVIKPDITAPGVQILAGHTPTPESPVEGPPGQYFQAIAGTSMSSPHIAGSAILIKALHPNWTPGQIKSALMTTATTDVVKEDGVTPADPFDVGAGRVDLTKAGNPGLTFDDSADNMFDLGTDELMAINVNLPSVNVPVLPGRVETTRTAFNVTGRRVKYNIVTSAPADSQIEVSPRKLNLAPDQFGTVQITVSSTAEDGEQRFGEIQFVPQGAPGLPTIHMPVAFVPQEGTVTLSSTCTPATIARTFTTTCTVTAQNQSFEETTVDLSTSVDKHLRIVGATGASVVGGRAVKTDAALGGAVDGTPAIAPGELFGYVPLDGFRPLVVPLADETLTNIGVPAFSFAGRSYASIGIDSNGYLVAGGGTAQDNNCCNVALPSPAAPNGILAPYWTDLDGSGAPGALVQTLTDGTNSWLVVEWRVNVFGTTSPRIFQTWIGIDGTEEITFSYDPATPRPKPAGQNVIVGAENRQGLGASLGLNVVPTTDLRVTSSAPVPGGIATYDVIVRGERVGAGVVTTEMDTDSVLGTTIQRSTVNVTKR